MKKLTTLSEWNSERSKIYNNFGVKPNGIQCPKCNEELWDGDPRIMVASFPPKKKVFCKGCGHIDYKII